MSFRKEEKLHVSKSQLLNLMNWIYKNDGYRLYEARIVSSTYFENESMQMFKDSEEGSVPRKKIRVRSYTTKEHKIDQSSFEVKTSSIEGRFKTIEKHFDLKKIMANGFFDINYGICKPIVRVNYRRDYYKIHNVRLTIDKSIEYIKINSQGKPLYKRYEPNIIVEIKAESFVPIEYLFKKFHFNRIRFSKYSNAINSFLG
jgi:hypothetical protein